MLLLIIYLFIVNRNSTLQKDIFPSLYHIFLKNIKNPPAQTARGALGNWGLAPDTSKLRLRTCPNWGLAYVCGRSALGCGATVLASYVMVQFLPLCVAGVFPLQLSISSLDLTWLLTDSGAQNGVVLKIGGQMTAGLPPIVCDGAPRHYCASHALHRVPSGHRPELLGDHLAIVETCRCV